eukprot:NODE_2364_length_1138_cov_272.100092_g1964_i0.p5 GENE.NODE_2364_length_1138_cov_272.100092_g1964_i0~~NODE_2364_length_1138_cov_272.100092_g1964_i0.p5  ORF type:complete len:52 (-),score=10.94 NODE_2364_length_1138_cov_272.100092_g1964_i0:848-1003(-)
MVLNFFLEFFFEKKHFDIITHHCRGVLECRFFWQRKNVSYASSARKKRVFV